MKDVSILNEMIFSASTENELQEKFKDIYNRINNESEYDDSGSVEFATSSGTDALKIALKSVRVEPGDESSFR